MLKGIDYLRHKLAKKRERVRLRYKYYDQKNSVKYYSKLLASETMRGNHHLGWCTKAVDSLADRLTVNKFRNDIFYMDEIYRMNNADILFRDSIKSALISSCSFIYISYADGYPTMQVIDGGNATGVMDDVTRFLSEGYAVLERNKKGRAKIEAYFTPDYTEFYEDGELVSTVPNPALYPLLVPIVNEPDATRPFGRSRISRACMHAQDDADRVLTNMEVSADYYAIPQKYVLGLSEDAKFNSQKADVSKFLAFFKDEQGDRPVVGQFQQSTMTPFIEQFKTCAAQFAGETGLTMDDLGFVQANPSSAEAIKVAHENLRVTAAAARANFATGFINAGFVAACVRDGEPYKRDMIKDVRLSWKPMFELDMSSIGAFGDAIYKLKEVAPAHITDEVIEDILGF